MGISLAGRGRRIGRAGRIVEDAGVRWRSRIVSTGQGASRTIRSATEPSRTWREAGPAVGGDDDQVDLQVDGVGDDGLDRAAPSDGGDDRSGRAPGGVEEPAEGLAGPLLVLLVVFRGHDRHQQRVGPGGEDLGEDVQQVQLGPQARGQPAGVAHGLLGMGAEVRRGQDGADLDHVASLSAQRSSRTRAWNRSRSSRVIGPGRPSPMTRPSHSTTGISSAAVPVRKHSSALKTSSRSIVRSITA